MRRPAITDDVTINTNEMISLKWLRIVNDERRISIYKVHVFRRVSRNNKLPVIDLLLPNKITFTYHLYKMDP